MRTYRELDPVPLAKRNQWECVRTFPMSELEQVVTAARQLNPALYEPTLRRSDRPRQPGAFADHHMCVCVNRAEGFVVCDAQFRRVKIKSPQYVAIAGLTTHDKNMTNKRRMLQVRLIPFIPYSKHLLMLHRMHTHAHITQLRSLWQTKEPSTSRTSPSGLVSIDT
jgi:hypothetical protein